MSKSFDIASKLHERVYGKPVYIFICGTKYLTKYKYNKN